MYSVAVSYLEWIRWVATGWFRCADRIVWVEGADDQSGIDAMLDRTPDLQIADDQGYVIACLRSDSLISARVSRRERSVGHLWLNLESVSSFHPLSIRGSRLLEADAERAAVRLGEPIFEKAWADWRDRRLEEETHWRGLSLCKAFGLELPRLENVAEQVGDILSGRKDAPNAVKVREDAIEGTRALGWASAMSVSLIETDVRAAFKDSPEFSQIQLLIKAHRTDFDLRRPLLDDETTVKFVRFTDGVLQKLGAKVPPLELMATVLHYRSLAIGGRQLTLSALVEDLVCIALADPNCASLSAYFIGRSMENVAVTTLLYQSNPTRYEAIVPAAVRQQLNILALAAARLEASLIIDEDQKTNPDTGVLAGVDATNQKIDPVSNLTEGVRVVEQVSDLPTVQGGLDSQSGNSLVPEITPSERHVDSNNTVWGTDSLIGVSEPQRIVIPSIPDKPDAETNQTGNSSPQPVTEQLQQPMEGLEPIAVSTKGKKTRKKSGKTS